MASSRYQRRHYEQAVRDILAAPTAKQEAMITKAIALFAADNPRFRSDFFRAALTGQRRDKSRPKRSFKPAKLDAFGLVKHSRRKMSARYYDREHTGRSQLRRMINVNVTIERGSTPTNASRSHGFFATACFGGKKTLYRYKACGVPMFGRTPTIAAKKALVSLGRNRDVK